MKKSKSEAARTSGRGRERASRAEPKRRTHFVPKVVFRTAVAGVIPVCVAVSSSDCGSTQTQTSVACIGFNGQPCGLPFETDASSDDSAADAGSASHAPQDSSANSASDGSLGVSATDGSFGDAGLDANAPDGSDE
jgi:hypothetical protein